jgi:hypothetical protein
MGRYQVPRSAQDSEEKKRREEGQNYDRPLLPPPVIEKKPTVRVYPFVDEEGKSGHESDAPLSPKSFHRLTKGRYKRPVELAKGGKAKSRKSKSRVNEAGNYTKPAMRKRLFNRIKAGGKGGRPGQWSARKAQMLASAYKKAGGGYRD